MKAFSIQIWLGAAAILGPCIPCGALASVFVRGDVNADGRVDISDPVLLLSCLFLGGGCPTCGDGADVNDSGEADISDSIYLLRWLFLGGPAPPPPSPSGIGYTPADCGLDPSSDGLDCAAFPPCSGEPLEVKDVLLLNGMSATTGGVLDYAWPHPGIQVLFGTAYRCASLRNNTFTLLGADSPVPLRVECESSTGATSKVALRFPDHARLVLQSGRKLTLEVNGAGVLTAEGNPVNGVDTRFSFLVSTTASAPELSRASLARLNLRYRAALEAELALLPEVERRETIDLFQWYGIDGLLSAWTNPWGTASGVRGHRLAIDMTEAGSAAGALEKAISFLEVYGIDLLGLNMGDLELAHAPDATGGPRRAEWQQLYQGLEVEGARTVVSLDQRGRITMAGGLFVPGIDLSTTPAISLARAVSEASAQLKRQIELLQSQLVVFHPLRLGNSGPPRLAWRLDARAPGAPERLLVWVDALDAKVLGIESLVKYLTVDDQVFDGRRGFEDQGVEPDSVLPVAFDTGCNEGDEAPPAGSIIAEVVWNGECGCDPDYTANRPIGPCEALDDVVGVTASLRAMEAFFAAEGVRIGGLPAHYEEWVGHTKFIINANSDPSIAKVSDGVAHFAPGAAAPDSVGHEQGHRLWGKVIGPFDIPVLGVAEGSAMAESVCDMLGAIVEEIAEEELQRLTDPWVMGDFLPTQSTIGSISAPDRPCSAGGGRDIWRSMRDPERDNGGWCEGVASYRNMFNLIEFFDGLEVVPDLSGNSGQLRSHMNNGIGNRMAFLMTDGVLGVGFEDFGRLFKRMTVSLGPVLEWATMREAFTDAADELYGDVVRLEPEERQVHAAADAVSIFTSPRQPLLAFDIERGGAFYPSADPLRRPSAARLAERGATHERLFVFYAKPDDTVAYIYSQLPRTDTGRELPVWRGECTVPGVETPFEPAAVGLGDTLWVVYTDPDGFIQAVELTQEGLGPEGGCNDRWSEPFGPAVPRLSSGSPAATEREEIGTLSLTCILPDVQFFNVPWPNADVVIFGEGGVDPKDCCEISGGTIAEPPIGFLGPFIEAVEPLLNSLPMQGCPSPVHPDYRTPDDGLAHTPIGFSLDTFAAPGGSAVQALASVPRYGQLFARGLVKGTAGGVHLNPRFNVDYSARVPAPKRGGGGGKEPGDRGVEGLELEFRTSKVLIAWRANVDAKSGVGELFLATWDSAEEDLAPIAADAATDPALVSWHERTGPRYKDCNDENAELPEEWSVAYVFYGNRDLELAMVSDGVFATQLEQSRVSATQLISCPTMEGDGCTIVRRQGERMLITFEGAGTDRAPSAYLRRASWQAGPGGANEIHLSTVEPDKGGFTGGGREQTRNDLRYGVLRPVGPHEVTVRGERFGQLLPASHRMIEMPGTHKERDRFDREIAMPAASMTSDDRDRFYFFRVRPDGYLEYRTKGGP